MKEIFLEESKKLQLEILKSIDECCRNNNLYYSLSWGTLIGAIRHKGFIPWDDDIDIMMSRKDYEFFLREYHDPKYELRTFEKGKVWGQFLTKVTDPRTVVYYGNHKTSPHGVWVSIFPYDNMPDVESKWTKIKLNYYVFCARLKGAIGTGETSSLKVFAKKCARLFLWHSSYYYSTHAENILKSYNNTDVTKIRIWDGGNKFAIFPKEWFDEFIEVDFEDGKFLSIKGYDPYLSKYYGNYMSFPPKETQVPTHNYKAFYKD
jgi:lipopolysaccharide cholinephosphotransferase